MNEDQERASPSEFLTPVGTHDNSFQEGHVQNHLNPTAIGVAHTRQGTDHVDQESIEDDVDDIVDLLTDRVQARRKSTEKAMLEATLTNLRNKLSDVEKDNWMYEAPRYTYK